MRITLLSNGYGEDTVGAALAEEFRRQHTCMSLQAFPIVDAGRAYERLDIPLLGPRRVMPSGGLLLHSLELFLRDMRAGFLPMTWRQIRDLRQVDTDVLVVIGDVYALALSSLVKTRARFYVQPLISVHHREARQWQWHRLFMEEYTGLELSLIRRFVAHMYVRDAATAAYLQQLSVDEVSALGNPMLDGLKPGARLGALELQSPVIGMLPGSRAYAANSLLTMLQALALWPEATGLVAWAAGALPDAAALGWKTVPADSCSSGVMKVLARGRQRVYILAGRLAEVLNEADLVLGTAGTANEQAAALGRPLVAFPLPPLYTPAFLDNQKRLLAEALTLSRPEPEHIAWALKELWHDPDRRRHASGVGRQRMGEPGGAAAIVGDILRRTGI